MATPELNLLTSVLWRLNAYSVEFRYPGESADRGLAKEAVQGAKTVRRTVRSLLGLPAGETS